MLGVHVDVHGEWVMLWVAACNVQCTCYTEHDRCGLSCTYAETVESMHEQCWVCMVCMVCVVYGLYGRLEFKLCCEIIAAEHGRYGSMEYCGVTKLSPLFI